MGFWMKIRVCQILRIQDGGPILRDEIFLNTWIFIKTSI